METIITNDDRIAIAEVDYIIHHMNESYLKKIPQKVQDYITILKSRSVEIYVNPRLPLEQQGLKEFTLYFLMILNLKYWCNDERRKDILARMEYNQKKVDEKIYNIFDQAENMQTAQDGVASQNNKPKQIVTVSGNNANEFDNIQKFEDVKETTNAVVEKPKENFFVKLINKIKSLISKNK